MHKHYKGSIVFLLEGSLRAIPFNIVLAILLALDLIYNKVPSLLIIIWFLSIVLISAIRWIFCYYLLKYNSKKANTHAFLIIFMLLTVLMGSVWGSCYWLMLPYVSELHEFIIILVLGGMCAGSIASLSSYLPAYYSYILPMFLPIIFYNYYGILSQSPGDRSLN